MLDEIRTRRILREKADCKQSTHPLKIISLQPSCDTYKYSFWPRTIIDWNSLPSDRMFTVLYFSVRSSRSSTLRYRQPAAILHECQNYSWDGGGLGGSEKNRSPTPPPPLPPSVHLKIKMVSINGKTRYISTISRKKKGGL